MESKSLLTTDYNLAKDVRAEAPFQRVINSFISVHRVSPCWYRLGSKGKPLAK